jgi:hypothetical protein
MKLFMELGGRLVNHSRASPVKVRGSASNLIKYPSEGNMSTEQLKVLDMVGSPVIGGDNRDFELI